MQNKSFTGRVVSGFGRGRQIGFPTVNLEVPTMPVPPGVYVVTAQGKQAVMMYGTAKTFDATHESVEIHFLESLPDPLPSELSVTALQHLRDIVKFKDVQELKTAIARDIERAKLYFSNAAE